MAKVIVYPQPSGGIALVIPTGELSVEDVASKDVPAGLPYLILEEKDVPTDQTFFEAFESDFSNPDGHGIGPDAWFAEQTIKEQAKSQVPKDSPAE